MEQMVPIQLVHRFVSGPEAQEINVHIFYGKKPRREGEYLAWFERFPYSTCQFVPLRS